MDAGQPAPKTRTSLRQRILAFVGALVLLSLLGSTISLYRITEVDRSLDAINGVSVPLGKLFAQLQSDVDVYRREAERRLGSAHWNERGWRPKAIPGWLDDVLESEIGRTGELIAKDAPWSTERSREHLRNWMTSFSQRFAQVREGAVLLQAALERGDYETASEFYPKWNASIEELARHLQWGAEEYERSLRQAFATAEKRVADLRTGLEIILVVVISLSLLLLWLGERALRPLGELTRMAREITLRGLKREDKALLPEVPLGRNDEVSQLSREFRQMATALLEREKTVESQKHRLQEQNRLLRQMGELNENILHSIESVLIVTDLDGRITQCNPGASRWLGVEAEQLIGTELLSWPKLAGLPGSGDWLARVKGSNEAWRIEPTPVDGRIFGGRVMPLHGERAGAGGAILALEDLTEEMDLQERLRRAENLAAVGRMSAQVAHEVRNPLHSIGLEAELAIDAASKLGSPSIKQSLQYILASVDRLEKITENYLKLSRLSAGDKRRVDLGEALESVLAIYAPACEAQAVQVDWSREQGASLAVWADLELLEQVLGNLFRNALQALAETREPRIAWKLGSAESGRVWLRIEDNGPGIAPEVRNRLFTPFVTTRAQGTGLGLSFVKKVIEEHGGTIECVAPESARGACFEIRLPAAEAVAESGRDAAAERQEVSADVRT